jgi:hypothetical protein
MTAESAPHGVRRLCIAFDLERYSEGNDAAQVEKQRAMGKLVREACERGALERAHWLSQEQGDGELALLPPGIDEARVIISLWREFCAGLHQYNRHANAGARLRMRLAAHEGLTYIADTGFAGTAVNTVCRLRDCREAKDALSGADGDLILIVSDRIYLDVIRGNDAHDLPASAFTETAIAMPDKGFQATAYIFRGRAALQGRLPAETPAPAQRSPGPGTPGSGEGQAIFSFGSGTTFRDAIQGTVYYGRGDDE